MAGAECTGIRGELNDHTPYICLDFPKILHIV